MRTPPALLFFQAPPEAPPVQRDAATAVRRDALTISWEIPTATPPVEYMELQHDEGDDGREGGEKGIEMGRAGDWDGWND